MTPRLIHPIFIYIAKLNIDANVKQWDDDFKQVRLGGVLKWKEKESDLIKLIAQKRTHNFRNYDKKKGGWIEETKFMFLCYTKDLVGENGRYKLDRGDKIVKMTDLKGRTKFDKMTLFIREFIPRGEYEVFHFIELHCENRVIPV